MDRYWSSCQNQIQNVGYKMNRIRQAGTGMIEVEVVAGAWVEYPRGMKAILGEVKRLNGIVSRGYCKRSQKLMGVAPAVVTRMKPNQPLYAGHVLSIHKLTRIPVRHLYALNQEACIPQAAEIKPWTIKCVGTRVIVNDQPIDCESRVDRLLAVLSLLIAPLPVVKQVLNSHESVIFNCRQSNVVTPICLINAHLYSGLPIDLLEDIVK